MKGLAIFKFLSSTCLTCREMAVSEYLVHATNAKPFSGHRGEFDAERRETIASRYL